MQQYFSGVSNNERYVIELHQVFQESVEDRNFSSLGNYVRNFEKEDRFVKFFIQHSESGYDGSINKLN